MKHDAEHVAEARRLAALPHSDQRAFVAMLRKVAANKSVADDDRRAARKRAAALVRLLKLEK